MSDHSEAPIEQQLLSLAEAISRGEIDIMSRYVSEGLIIRDEYPGLPAGREGFKLRLRLWEAALPDLELTISDVTVTGDEAEMTLAWSGTHLGELFGMAGSGERVSGSATVRTRWAAGQMTEWHCMGSGSGELQGE